MSSFIKRPPATKPMALLTRIQKLQDANICAQQTIRVQINESERLIAVIEETRTSIEDVSGWFKQLKGTLRLHSSERSNNDMNPTPNFNARIEKRDDGVHVLVPTNTLYELGKNLGWSRSDKNAAIPCNVQGTETKLFIEPINDEREQRV